jgi:NADH-quinone oxidoreductase subunit C
MNNEILKNIIDTHLGGTSVSQVDAYGMLNVNIGGDQLLSLVGELNTNHGFIYLTDICASHYPERSNAEFEVIYHLHNLVKNVRVRLKVSLPKSNLDIPTLTDLFVGANWMERETFDFYGIQFVGHPDLRRILNMDDMDYHPLRKQYALEDETRTDKNDTFFGR